MIEHGLRVAIVAHVVSVLALIAAIAVEAPIRVDVAIVVAVVVTVAWVLFVRSAVEDQREDDRLRGQRELPGGGSDRGVDLDGDAVFRRPRP